MANCSRWSWLLGFDPIHWQSNWLPCSEDKTSIVSLEDPNVNWWRNKVNPSSYIWSSSWFCIRIQSDSIHWTSQTLFVWQMNKIADRLPHIRFWLPTREVGLMKQFVREFGSHAIPDNLIIRVSAAMVGGDAVSIEGCHQSRVDKVGSCPAPQQGNKCGDCRACWDKSVATVTYSLH